MPPAARYCAVGRAWWRVLVNQLAEGGEAQAHSHMVFRLVPEARDDETVCGFLTGTASRDEQEAVFSRRQVYSSMPIMTLVAFMTA